MKAGDFAAALAAYNDLITVFNQTNHPSAAVLGFTGRGKALAGLKEYDAAIDDFKKVTDSDAN